MYHAAEVCAHGMLCSCVWNVVMVSMLTQPSENNLHSVTVLTKNECLYCEVCEHMHTVEAMLMFGSTDCGS